jgi:nitrogen fixation protein FixH
MKTPHRKAALRNPWVVGWIVMIVFVLTVNIAMIIIAHRTSPGLVVKDYYDRGKNYDKTLEKRVEEKALDWEMSLLVPDRVSANRPSDYHLLARDDRGRPIHADHVRFFAFRPSDAGADFSVIMEEEADGKYSGSVTFPFPGVWDIIVSVKRGSERFEITRRIFAGKSGT